MPSSPISFFIAPALPSFKERSIDVVTSCQSVKLVALGRAPWAKQSLELEICCALCKVMLHFDRRVDDLPSALPSVAAISRLSRFKDLSFQSKTFAMMWISDKRTGKPEPRSNASGKSQRHPSNSRLPRFDQPLLMAQCPKWNHRSVAILSPRCSASVFGSERMDNGGYLLWLDE